jgi:hypothetical protein
MRIRRNVIAATLALIVGGTLFAYLNIPRVDHFGSNGVERPVQCLDESSEVAKVARQAMEKINPLTNSFCLYKTSRMKEVDVYFYVARDPPLVPNDTVFGVSINPETREVLEAHGQR